MTHDVLRHNLEGSLIYQYFVEGERNELISSKKIDDNYIMVLLIAMFYWVYLFNMCAFVSAFLWSSKLNLKCNIHLSIIHLWYKCAEHSPSGNKCSNADDFKVCESLASVRWLGALYLSGKEEAKDRQMAQTVEMKDRDGGVLSLFPLMLFFNRI